MVCCQLILCGEASSKRLPGIIPAGYVSQTGYQYDSISRVAGHRELAPPSKFSKLGGFNSNVFITSGILHPQSSGTASFGHKVLEKRAMEMRLGTHFDCAWSPPVTKNSLPE